MHLETNHKTIVLCNNEIAFPAIRELTFYGVLKAVVVPEKNKEVCSMLQQFLLNSGIKVVTVNKKTMYAVIKDLITKMQVNTVWLMTFPYIIPGTLLSLLPGAFLNFHYGLLPKYRGPNPILAQMLNYETHGGLSIHVMDEDVDTGPLILQHKLPIEDKDTFGIQLQKLGQLGAEITVHLLKILHFSTVIPASPQDTSQAHYFNRVTAAELMLQWQTMTAWQIIRMINACNPWNKGAGTTISSNIVCFVEAEITQEAISGNWEPGMITELSDKEGLKVFCVDGKIIRINIIYIPEGFFSGRKLIDFGIKVRDRFI